MKVALYTLPLLITEQVLACSACGFGEDETTIVYLATTGLLSFVPLIFIGGIFFYIKKQYFSN